MRVGRPATVNGYWRIQPKHRKQRRHWASDVPAIKTLRERKKVIVDHYRRMGNMLFGLALKQKLKIP